jgi:hypothetical protein
MLLADVQGWMEFGENLLQVVKEISYLIHTPANMRSAVELLAWQ